MNSTLERMRQLFFSSDRKLLFGNWSLNAGYCAIHGYALDEMKKKNPLETKVRAKNSKKGKRKKFENCSSGIDFEPLRLRGNALSFRPSLQSVSTNENFLSASSRPYR